MAGEHSPAWGTGQWQEDGMVSRDKGAVKYRYTGAGVTAPYE